MPSYAEILKKEDANHDRINLYASGNFYHAYNHSAWLACMLMHDFKVNKEWVQAANRVKVMVGFPKASLAKWANGMTTNISDELCEVVVPADRLPKIDGYDEWFNSIPLSEGKAVDDGSPRDGRRSKPKADDVYREIGQRVARYPLETKSPMECMLFVARLRQMAFDE